MRADFTKLLQIMTIGGDFFINATELLDHAGPYKSAASGVCC